jgi:hypothetical protein
MRPSSTIRFAAAIALAIVAGGSGVAQTPTAGREPKATTPVNVKEPGDLWEVTTQMSMAGMQGISMPPQTNRVCSDRQWNKPPVNMADHGCKTSDFRSTPTKSSWKMSCDGPPAMTGEGEITRSGPEAYQGWMKLNSEQGLMNMTLSGKRVGDCDAGAVKAERAATQAKIEAQIAQSQQQSEAAVAQACQAPVDQVDVQQLQMMSGFCTDPALKGSLCGRLDTVDGFTRVCERPPDSANGLSATANFCGQDADALHKKYCDEALQKESLDLLGKCCPTEARVIAQRECAGRSYTGGASSKYAGFCMRYASDLMAGGANDPNAEKPETTKEKTKKTLKSIIPH